MSQPIPGYLRTSLETDERPVAVRGLHVVFLFNGIFWLMLIAGGGWAFDLTLWHYFGAFVPTYEMRTGVFDFGLRPGWIGGFFTVSGAAIFFIQFLRYATTKIAVTTKRIVIKRGWINIRLDQTDLSDVRGLHVDQGWLGRFLNYGSVVLDCRFVKDVSFPYVARPYEIVSVIQKMKTKVEERMAGLEENPSDTHHGPPQHGQTIIQINPLPIPGGRTVIERGDERIVIETSAPMRGEEVKKLSSDILHEDILEEFKKNH